MNKNRILCIPPTSQSRFSVVMKIRRTEYGSSGGNLKNFMPQDAIPRYSYFACLILAVAIAIFASVDTSTTSVDNQFSGNLTTFSKNGLLVLLSLFYAACFLHALVKWFYIYAPHAEDLPVSVLNMNWNFSSFFGASFLFLLFTVIQSSDKIFLFAIVYTIQVICGLPNLACSVFREYMQEEDLVA